MSSPASRRGFMGPGGHCAATSDCGQPRTPGWEWVGGCVLRRLCSQADPASPGQDHPVSHVAWLGGHKHVVQAGRLLLGDLEPSEASGSPAPKGLQGDQDLGHCTV